MATSILQRFMALPRDRSWHERRQGSDERVQLRLTDLDDVRGPIVVGVKSTSGLDHIDDFLKRHYRHARNNDDDEDGKGKKINRDTHINFYSKERRLSSNELPHVSSILYYQVMPTQEGDASSIRIKCSNNCYLKQDQVDQLESQIREGMTIRELRRSVASAMLISDPYRIIIRARGGMRPGSVNGDNWEVRKLRMWLCRTIYIDLARQRNYIVFRGVNEEYVYHPSHWGIVQAIEPRAPRDWLYHRILKDVHLRPSSSSHRWMNSIDPADDIKLRCRGKLITTTNSHSHSHSRRRSSPWTPPVEIGQTVDFELPSRRIEERFIAAEAWLLPLSETCIVCGDQKRVSQMPARRVSPNCDHEPSTCRDCVTTWIASCLDSRTWDRVRCPECPALLGFDDVKAVAGKEVFNRYDMLATKAALEDIRRFRWCFNPRCEAGQIDRTSCPKVKCFSCNASSCGIHNIPWHSGETCEEYDRRTHKQRKNNIASEKHIKALTKACPKCHLNVHKYTGCDHITCMCGHEWCYVCLETYFHDDEGLLQCKHGPNCKHLANPPHYEGGRAFLQFFNDMIPHPPPRPPRRADRPRAPPMDPVFLEALPDRQLRPPGRRVNRAADVPDFDFDAVVRDMWHMGRVMNRAEG